MNMPEFEIKSVTVEDTEALLQIYAPYVLNTAISFEYEVPSIEEFRQRISSTLAVFPYIKAVGNNGEIYGYAYAGRFGKRRAYDWTAESSIYVRQDMRGTGLGRALYSELEARLKSLGIQTLIACVAFPIVEDEYLSLDSFRFHERLGYRPAGHFHKVGYKFGTWYDMAYLEKPLGTYPDTPLPIHY